MNQLPDKSDLRLFRQMSQTIHGVEYRTEDALLVAYIYGQTEDGREIEQYLFCLPGHHFFLQEHLLTAPGHQQDRLLPVTEEEAREWMAGLLQNQRNSVEVQQEPPRGMQPLETFFGAN